MKKWLPLIGLGIVLSFLPVWRDIYGDRNNFWQMLWGNLEGGDTCEHLTTEVAIEEASRAYNYVNVPC